MQVGLNVPSELIDFFTSALKGPDSPLPSTTLSDRPLQEALQIVADVVDRVQVKSTIRAENCLFRVKKIKPNSRILEIRPLERSEN